MAQGADAEMLTRKTFVRKIAQFANPANDSGGHTQAALQHGWASGVEAVGAMLGILLIVSCSKPQDADPTRPFLFARFDTEREHENGLRLLRKIDPTAYLKTVKAEQSDEVWLKELAQLQPAAYRSEMDRRAQENKFETPPPMNPKQKAAMDAKIMADARAFANEHPDTGQWQFDSSTDAMRGSATETACVRSDDQLNFEFPYNGGSTGTLCLRKSPKFGEDVYLSINKGQFVCVSFLGCHVHMKFDHGPIITFAAVESADGTTNTIFILPYGKILRLLKGSRQLIVEAAYYQAGEQQLTFPVAGLIWK